jgi:hypothetical protein
MKVIILKSEIWEILIFEQIFVIENSIQLQKLVLERNINWATNITLGAIMQVIAIFILKLQFSCQIFLFIKDNITI